ncbi:regulatory protein RecX [Desulfotignum phosphitoxidans]|jgi:regulatory protein|uniref:Regulatory protein RecX n=1 Tax=Desulfotignum phosphitoxidans DSM 13687 TaxID=1286635 RepID=S0FX53_9BACT|nr:regulatory protein RecX [Desulfotignum phosphitoxidans]EMS79305.1 regulatory protein RecX [Desulfotignum phosphitoxidans DSM 13687]
MSLFDDTPDPQEEKLFQTALRYLAIRPRSVGEMTGYLAKKSQDPAHISTVIDRLKQYRYLNDEEFARIFIENRKRNQPKSKFALTRELRQKGIRSQIISDLLDSYDDMQMAVTALAARYQRWHHLDPETRQKKAFNYLRYRGFNYEAIRFAWEQVAKDADFSG